jgi:hypothetical protein
MSQDKPVAKYRVGNVSAAVWKSDAGYSVTLQKSFKDKETDEWRNTESLFHGDILNAMKALERAEVFCSK